MLIPSSAAERLLVEGSSLVVALEPAAGTSEEALGGHRGLMKNSGGNGFDVSGIPTGIRGLLLHMLCAKAQQP